MLKRGHCYQAFTSTGPADSYFEKTQPDGRRLEIHGRRSEANGLEVFFGVYDADGGQLEEQHHVHCELCTLEQAMIWAACLAQPIWLDEPAAPSQPIRPRRRESRALSP